MNRLKGGNFPGSSGYWGDLGDRAARGGMREGLGYPGDRARAQIAAEEGVQVPGLTSRLGGVRFSGTAGGGRPQTSANLYEPIQITKSAGLAAGANRLLGEFNEEPVGFDELLRQAKEAAGGLRAAYEREQGAYNIDDYARRLRGLDDRLERLTGSYAGTARDVGGRFAASDREYAGDIEDVIARAYGILPEYDRAAENIVQNQEAQLQGRLSRYLIGKGNLGLGGDELRKIARGVADVRLPLERERIQRQYDVLTGVELPGQREIATREASRLSQFELPMERDIYQQFYATDLQRKNTENQIKQLELSTAGMSRAAAESYLRSLALPSELINMVLQRRNQTLAGQISNLGGIGAIEDSAYYRGLEYLPGSGPLANQAYYSTNLPAYPAPNYNYSLPSRLPTTTGTGTNRTLDPYMAELARSGTVTLPNSYNWGRSPTEQARFEAVQRSYE